MRYFLALLLVPLTGCGLLWSRKVVVEQPTGETESGVLWEDVLAGEGPPAEEGSDVTIHYTADVLDGEPVDSTYDRGLPVSFRVGSAPVIGWNEGVVGMKAGGRRRLVVPPWLAYGDEGVPGLVPPRATLDFLIELIRIEAP